MPPVWLFALLPFEAAILWIALDIRRKVERSTKDLKVDVEKTREEFKADVANALGVGLSVLRGELPKGDDDAG